MLEREKTVIGYIPTRRDVFSASEARRYRDIILERIKSFNLCEVIDMDGINPEGLLYSESDVDKVVQRMQSAGADGLFFPHCNFGTEDLVAKVAAKTGKPVLLWGPRDDSPLEDGLRTRDTQCGLFATGKVLRRFNVPFTYIENSYVEDKVFSDGFESFVRVCSAVKAFRRAKVLQIDTRPAGFWTVMCNEGELLEKFGVQVFPVTLSDIAIGVNSVLAEKGAEYEAALEKIRMSMDVSKAPAADVGKLAALKVVMSNMCAENGCNCAAIQCWSALQKVVGIMPCVVNGIMMDEFVPVACETDIHGALTALILQEAATSPVFFADLTVRHPENENAELLWHCGNFPPSLAKKNSKKELGRHFIFEDHMVGTGEWELEHGDITICRFDGDHGQYQFFFGEGKGVDGPGTKGTYVWFEVKDWPRWERKLVEGPYIHHCAGAYGKYADTLRELCKYIPGLEPDFAE
jgi:L-fucose isomerase-like protein